VRQSWRPDRDERRRLHARPRRDGLEEFRRSIRNSTIAPTPTTTAGRRAPRDQMAGKGWLAERDRADTVAMCAPG